MAEFADVLQTQYPCSKDHFCTFYTGWDLRLIRDHDRVLSNGKKRF
jgi:hypothetical protein